MLGKTLKHNSKDKGICCNIQFSFSSTIVVKAGSGDRKRSLNGVFNSRDFLTPILSSYIFISTAIYVRLAG